MVKIKQSIKLLGLVISVLIILEIIGTLLVPEVQKHFYNVLEKKEISNFLTAITFLAIVNFSLDIVVSLKRWIVLKLSFSWRHLKYLKLRELWANSNKNVANYSTALTTALSLATEAYLTLGVEIVISFVIVVSLIITHSDNHLVLMLSGLYTIVICGLAILFHKPLTNTDKLNQLAEGRHREFLISHNSIPLAGIPAIHEEWTSVVLTSIKKFNVIGLFTVFTKAKGTLATVVGLVLLSPKYFNGSITLGDFMGTLSVFQLIVINTTYIVDLYPRFTQAKASSLIIKQFEKENK